ncbi:hypothetical protein [Arthrobacter mobilis]|uniref:Lipoprotein n=1 Tax=Arthrobacter mobilis TaxID=2724944 RepID=A0A7X6HHQ1_9MICC|nr:hypothetical protein [Arthrobacter mobilis]NKX56316.1 hypothetical protein [Arthrobacter mobilis]
MRSISAVLVLAAALLTGCTGSATISALEAPRTGQDTLPAGAEGIGVAPESARLAGEKDGYAFYLARREDDPSGTSVCVVIGHAEDEDGWGAGCSTAVSPADEAVLHEFRGIKAIAVTDGYDPQEKVAAGWEQLGGNLLVLMP